MKKFPSLVLLAAALLSGAALPAATFEGKVAVNMIAPGQAPMPITHNIKEGRDRIEFTVEKQGTMSTILDSQKQEMIMLMPAQKMYMLFPLKAEKTDAKAAEKPSDVTFEQTSETEKILGYTCRKYLAKSKKDTTEIWATEQLGAFMGMGGAGGSPGRRGGPPVQQAWEKALVGKDFFPLRIVSVDAKGKETFRMETTAVEKQSLPDALFVPPADFQEFKMPSLGDMMKGMIPGR